MECVKCKTEMKKVKFATGTESFPPQLHYKKKVFQLAIKSDVSCWVCPECGYIELFADEPDNFKHI